MNAVKRFLILSLLGIFIAVGLGGVGRFTRAGYAAAPWPAMVAQGPGTPPAEDSAADDLAIPEDSDATPPTADPATLDLPDFEPKLPAESLPEAVTEDNEDLWNEGAIESSEADGPELTEAQLLLIEADKYYLAGELQAAENLYRQVKDEAWDAEETESRPAPVFDPAALSAAGAVYWREAQAGYERGLTHRTTVPLKILVEEYPEFIPGHVFYATYLLEQEQPAEADQVLDQALIAYPSEPALLQARASTQMALEQWIEAAITARQFAVLNPDHPDADAMATLSDENMDRFRSEMNAQLTQNFVGNVLLGAASAVLTGGLFGPYSAINSGLLLLQGESAVGASAAEQIKQQAPMMNDPAVNAYLDNMGQKLARLAGRDEFDYDFYVIEEPELNAFALPGGKIFVNAGAIMEAHSEAEVAGLMAHEISHAVLSHGFQMVTNGNLLNSLASIIPIPQVGGIAAGLAFSGYSRQMERQADILGTQILAAAGYAADGLHNLMVTLEEEAGDRGGIQWFASHPAPQKRVDYLKQLVDAGGYNRYAYEGMETHLAMQRRVRARMGAPEDGEDSPETEAVPDSPGDITDDTTNGETP